jgi:hypothetical protein
VAGFFYAVVDMRRVLGIIRIIGRAMPATGEPFG